MKYLKLFNEGLGEEKILIKDKIIRILLNINHDVADQSEEYDDWDICDAIACFTNQYNEQFDPLIIYLNNLLEKVKFKPGISYSYNEEDLDSYYAKEYFDLIVENHEKIYDIICYDLDHLNYLRQHDKYFYDYIMNYIRKGNDDSNLGQLGKMIDMGF
jgi:hypothetical protein